MLHPFEVSVVSNVPASKVVIARRGTIERAEQQAAALRKAIGTYHRDDVPTVLIRDLRDAPSLGDEGSSDADAD
jgi:hypothetical protein